MPHSEAVTSTKSKHTNNTQHSHQCLSARRRPDLQQTSVCAALSMGGGGGSRVLCCCVAALCCIVPAIRKQRRETFPSAEDSDAIDGWWGLRGGDEEVWLEEIGPECVITAPVKKQITQVSR